jgi:hypothetical protein
MAEHVLLHREHFNPYLNILHHCLTVPFARKPLIIHDGFPQHAYFGMKKVDNSSNVAAVWITNHRIHHKSRCRDKNKH